MLDVSHRNPCLTVYVLYICISLHKILCWNQFATVQQIVWRFNTELVLQIRCSKHQSFDYPALFYY